MKYPTLTTKLITKTYEEYVKYYQGVEELPSVFTFLQQLGIDTIYISNMIKNISNTKGIKDRDSQKTKDILNTINDCIINIKELLIHKLINSKDGKNALNIIKILDSHYNTLLGDYAADSGSTRAVVVNIVERDNKKNLIKI